MSFAGCRLGRIVTAALCLGWVGAAAADEAPAAPTPDPSFVIPDGPANPALEVKELDGAPVPELWFPVNEELVFSIRWSFLPVGQSHAWVEWVRYGERTLLAIRMRSRSNKVLSTLYPVDDYVESLVDARTFLPVRFWKRISEGSTQHDEVTYFHHAAGTAVQVDRRTNTTNEFAIAADERCLPSLMYHLRREAFPKDDRRTYRAMADDGVYEVEAVFGKAEAVALPRYGKVSSLKIEPVARFGGVFVRKGRMWMWVSEDPRRIATRIVAEVPVGSVQIVLAEVRGGGNDAWVKKEGETSSGKEEK